MGRMALSKSTPPSKKATSVVFILGVYLTSTATSLD